MKPDVEVQRGVFVFVAVVAAALSAVIAIVIVNFVAR